MPSLRRPALPSRPRASRSCLALREAHRSHTGARAPRAATLVATLALSWLLAVPIAMGSDGSHPGHLGRVAQRHRGARHRRPGHPGAVHRGDAVRRHRRHHVRPANQRPTAPPGSTSGAEPTSIAPSFSGSPAGAPVPERTPSEGSGEPVPANRLAPAYTFPAVGIAAWDQLQEKSLAEVERQFSDYGTLRARWVRADFAWDVIQPAKTTFRWAGYDQWVGVAHAKGLNVIATVDYTPAWANGGHSDHSYAPTSPAAFGAFAGLLAARYAPQGVHVYEIWNEPNIIQYWKPKPDPAAYTESLNAAYAAIKRADPGAIVLTGGSSPAGTGTQSYSPQDWLRALYAARAKFDGVSDHPYVDDTGFNWKVMSEYSGSTLRGIMEAHGDAAKRVWATEVGCSWQKVSKVESAGRAICAERLEQAFARWHGYSWGAALCWFTYWDPNVYGLVDEHWTPRPTWYAFQAAAAQYP